MEKVQATSASLLEEWVVGWGEEKGLESGDVDYDAFVY